MIPDLVFRAALDLTALGLVACGLYSVHLETLEWSVALIRDPMFWFFAMLALYCFARMMNEVRADGWSDEQIAEAIYVTAMFALFNRVSDAFGLQDPGLIERARQGNTPPPPAERGSLEGDREPALRVYAEYNDLGDGRREVEPKGPWLQSEVAGAQDHGPVTVQSQPQGPGDQASRQPEDAPHSSPIPCRRFEARKVLPMTCASL